MPRNESQRAAHNKYESKTYKLKELLAAEGLTPNAFLTKCCMDYIKKHEPEE